ADRVPAAAAVEALASATPVPNPTAGAGSGAGAGAEGADALAQNRGAQAADTAVSLQARLWGGAGAPDAAHVSVPHVTSGDGGPAGSPGSAARAVFERRTPPGEELTTSTPRHEPSAAEDDDEGASLEASELASRLRAALLPLGFRLEPLGRGQLIVHADMGRRGYRVLVQLLSRS